MSEKSQVTRTSKNLFEKSNRKTLYFVREVKVRRMTRNGVEFLIGWSDFPLDKDDTWEPITNLPGSELMMRGVILRMRMGSMRMGQGVGVVGKSHTPNGDRLAVFTSQQQQ